MASQTWNLSKDTTTAGGAVDYGNGADQHAPIGLWSGWVYRHFAQYTLTNLASMASISNAVLHIKSTGQQHVAFGSSPTIKARRVTSSWTGSGGSEGSWSGSASPKDSTQPSTTSSGETTTNMTESENTWDTLSVTTIAQAWLSGSTNYGIRLAAGSEASTADTWEGYAQASSYDSYIVVTYTPVVVSHEPVATALAPLTGDVADLDFVAESGWASPRPTVSWDFSDPDGHTQSAYQVIVYNDSGGSPGSTLIDTGKITSSAQSYQVAATFTEGNHYHWKVQVWDSTDLVSLAYSATQRFRARWGAAEYYGDLTSTPSSWSLDSLVTAGNVVIEYNSTTDTADPGGSLETWRASLASVTKRRYVRWRVWLLPSSGPAPSLSYLRLLYSTSATPDPDDWTMSANADADTATQVYGSRSLRIDGAGSDQRTYQLVSVHPQTTYQLSGRIKQSALEIGAFLALGTTGTGGQLVAAPASQTQTDWTDVGVEWFSGSSAEVYVQCGISGTGSAWYDVIKLEASSTATEWHPALLGSAVAIDASGIKIDSSLGASLRLRASTGGTRDTVELGAGGLVFGGDMEIDSSVANTLRVDGGTGFVDSKKPVRVVYTSDNTWTKPTGIQWIEVEVVGAGGAGAGCADPAAAEATMGSGGGGGGYARKIFTAADLSGDTTFDVIVGVTTVADANDGATGEASSFAGTGISTVQGNGGVGGITFASGTTDLTRSGGAGGTASGGDINVTGSDGGHSLRLSGTVSMGGTGGSSALGGGVGNQTVTGSQATDGLDGAQYGGGGGGAQATNGGDGTSANGGNGAAGVVIVTEHYA